MCARAFHCHCHWVDADHGLAKLVTSLERTVAEQRRLLHKTSGRVSPIADSSPTEMPSARVRRFGAAPAPVRLTEMEPPEVGLAGTTLLSAHLPPPPPPPAAPIAPASSQDAQVCVPAFSINQATNKCCLFCQAAPCMC